MRRGLPFTGIEGEDRATGDRERIGVGATRKKAAGHQDENDFQNTPKSDD